MRHLTITDLLHKGESKQICILDISAFKRCVRISGLKPNILCVWSYGREKPSYIMHFNKQFAIAGHNIHRRAAEKPK